MRGAALVETVIASLSEDSEEVVVPVPEPVPAAILSTLRFTDGSPLPPSLRRWLAYDGGFAARDLGWFDDPDDPVLEARTVEELVRDPLRAPVWAPYYRRLPAPLPRALAAPLDVGDESMCLLLLASPDAEGEYPVLWLRNRSEPTVGVQAAGFDVWLAASAGLDASEHDEATAAVRARLLGGAKALACRLAVDDTPDSPSPRAPARAPRALPPFVAPAGVEPSRLATALMLALDAGKLRRARGYLRALHEAQPEAEDWKDLAIVCATRGASVDEALVRELLALGARPDAALPYAAAREVGVGALGALLEAGADPNGHASSGDDRGTALHDAAGAGNLAAVEALLTAGARPDESDGVGRTPLFGVCHAAVADLPTERRVAIARTLLDAGASANLLSKVGLTPLGFAVGARQLEVARLLLSRGADPDLPGQREPPLVTAWRDRQWALYDLLREHGARVDAPTGGPFTLCEVSTDDGRCPRVLRASLELDATPQRVTLRVRSVRLPGFAGVAGPLAFPGAAGWLARWAEAGMAGSDVMPPMAGMGRDLTPPRAPGAAGPGKSAPTEGPFFEAERVFELAGVAPALVAMWVTSIRDLLGPLAELSLEGERPLADPPSPGTIDAARVARWLRGELEGPPRPAPGAPPFAVVNAGKRRRALAVWLEPWPSADALRRFDSALSDAMRRLGTGIPALRAAVTRDAVAWTAEPSAGDLEVKSVAPLRAVALAGLARLGGVARVEWALGVAGEDGTDLPAGEDLSRWKRDAGA